MRSTGFLRRCVRRTALGFLALALPAFSAPVDDPLDSAEAVAALIDGSRRQYVDGDYSEARRLANEAVAMLARIPDADPAQQVAAHRFLAVSAQVLGDFSTARQGFQQALAILERQGEDGRSEYATTLGYLAYLTQVQGDLDEAEKLHLRVLQTLELLHGEDDVRLVATLTQLGYLQRRIDQIEPSIRSFERALRIQRAAESDDEAARATVAGIRRGLAHSLEAVGRFDEAGEHFAAALSTLRDLRGSEHPELIGPLTGLAGLARRAGNHEEALALYREALTLAEAFRPAAPEVGEIQHETGVTLLHLQRRDEALDLAFRSAAGWQSHFREAARTLPERQALVYLERVTANLDLAFSLAAVDGTLARHATRLWDATILARASVLDEMAWRQRAVRRSDDPEIRRLADALLATRRRRPHADPDATRGEREAAEQSLAVAALPHRDDAAQAETTLSAIAGALSPDTVLVAYVQPRVLDLSTPWTSSQEPDGRPTVMAFVLPRDRSRATLIDLGPARLVDARVEAWRREASRGPLRRKGVPDAAIDAYRKAGGALREAVWDPLLPFLDGAGRVLIVPDGSLHLVAFAGLPIGADTYLVDQEPALHLLSAERDVLSPASDATAGEGLLAVGGVDFDLANVPDPPGATPGTPGRRDWTFRGGLPDCRPASFTGWPQLPGTSREIEAIAQLWSEARRGPVQVLRGATADETRFKRQVAGHRVLHVSTHGFFYSDRCADTSAGTRGIGGIAPREDPESTLLRSGLVLAGANAARAVDGDDGILTAEEIATLDLDGVEWAVLSACDTGLGRVQAGEGVLGLRRAFRIAGADTVIMSLWAVEDESGFGWMQELYRSRAREGLTTIDAVRAASRAVLASRRATGESTHPFFWAGFIAAGDWR